MYNVLSPKISSKHCTCSNRNNNKNKNDITDNNPNYNELWNIITYLHRNTDVSNNEVMQANFHQQH